MLPALAAGPVAGLFEETAWTGFATHDLLKRHRVVATGIIVGLGFLFGSAAMAGAPDDPRRDRVEVGGPVGDRNGRDTKNPSLSCVSTAQEGVVVRPPGLEPGTH